MVHTDPTRIPVTATEYADTAQRLFPGPVGDRIAATILTAAAPDPDKVTIWVPSMFPDESPIPVTSDILWPHHTPAGPPDEEGRLLLRRAAR